MCIKLNWSINSLAISKSSSRQEFKGILDLSNIKFIYRMSDFKTQEVDEMSKIFHLKLLTMMSSMNGLNTSRSIIILSVIILSMVLLSWSQSPLKINLQKSSPSHILKNVFVLWLTISSWFHIHLEFEEGC